MYQPQGFRFPAFSVSCQPEQKPMAAPYFLFSEMNRTGIWMNTGYEYWLLVYGLILIINNGLYTGLILVINTGLILGY